MAQYNLFGNVVSLQSVNLANSPRDALLLAFADAKLSIVEYDPETHDLRTLSLHYFEEEDMKVSCHFFAFPMANGFYRMVGHITFTSPL